MTEVLRHHDATDVAGDSPAETSKQTVEQLQRHFQHNFSNWCLKHFGAKQELVPGQTDMAKRQGAGLDLVPKADWENVKAAGVKIGCALPDMGVDAEGKPIAPFDPGFNNPVHADRVRTSILRELEDAAKSGIPNIIVFTGMATAEDRDAQFSRIVEGFTKSGANGEESLVAAAERLGVTMQMEMLNTEDQTPMKGHPGYLGNSTAELVEKVVRPVGSKRFRLLYDIYHSSVMGEDVHAMIDAYAADMGMIHVAGMQRQEGVGFGPQNRGELNHPDQKINYPAIMAHLAKKVPKGTPLLHEYIPNTDAPAVVEKDLAASIALCEPKDHLAGTE